MYLVSNDEDDNPIPLAKSREIKKRDLMIFERIFLYLLIEIATESTRSDSIDSTKTIEDEQRNSPIKCDTCQEIFSTSEQFNQHRLYQCSFLTGNSCLINH